MSFRINGITVICKQDKGECELCGKVAELRPYGPGYKNICFECGQKDIQGTEERMSNYLFGND